MPGSFVFAGAAQPEPSLDFRKLGVLLELTTQQTVEAAAGNTQR